MPAVLATFGACFCMLSKLVVEQHAFELQVLAAFGACSCMLSKLVVEQHAFELHVLAAFGASFGVLSKFIVEHVFGQAFVRLFAGAGSVACVTQHEGNLILIISAQRHSALSRAILHRARECSISMRGFT